MVRVCLPAINQVNQDLTFRAEIPEEFPDSKLPTLDFFLWLELSGLLNHSYFQKSMKTPLLIMASSAMGQQHRHAILSNDNAMYRSELRKLGTYSDLRAAFVHLAATSSLPKYMH